LAGAAILVPCAALLATPVQEICPGCQASTATPDTDHLDWTHDGVVYDADLLVAATIEHGQCWLILHGYGGSQEAQWLCVEEFPCTYHVTATVFAPIGTSLRVLGAIPGKPGDQRNIGPTTSITTTLVSDWGAIPCPGPDAAENAIHAFAFTVAVFHPAVLRGALLAGIGLECSHCQ